MKYDNWVNYLIIANSYENFECLFQFILKNSLAVELQDLIKFFDVSFKIHCVSNEDSKRFLYFKW